MINNIKKCDKLVLIFLIVYSLLGLVMVFSASSVSTVLRYHVSVNHFWIRQLLFIGLGLLAGAFILCIPTKKYRLVSWAYAIAVGILLVFIFTYGKLVNTAQSWYKIGRFNLQPSEFAKSAIIIFMATYYDLLSRKKIKNIASYFIPIALLCFYTVMVILQPDLGSAILIFLIGLGIFLSIPVVRRNFKKTIKLGVIIVLVLGVWFALSGKNLLSDSKLGRFTYKEPCTRYREANGYQVCNGLIAIHNGGLFGVGLGNSTQKRLYLPESHTDFIFPIIVEELGLVTGIAILIGYLVILIRILQIAKGTYTLRDSILCYGTFIYLAVHIFVNLGGILVLIPLTGVPLPLLSYGGSYTLNVIVMLFVVLRVSIENKNHIQKNEMKKLV